MVVTCSPVEEQREKWRREVPLGTQFRFVVGKLETVASNLMAQLHPLLIHSQSVSYSLHQTISLQNLIYPNLEI